MHFTQEDYKKIENWLLKNSVKDSEFQEALPLNGSETVVITQNGHNRNMTVQELSNKVIELGVSDFINVSDNFDTYGISLIEAINLIPFHLRKKGVVITFCNTENNWEIYQFTGVLNQWNNITLWNDIFNIKRYAVNSLLPDEEDTTRTEIDKNGNSYLKLKDKEYNPLEFSGYGKKTLRKKIVTVQTGSKSSKRINILEGSVFKDPNTIYEIKYDFDLNNSTVTLPENCILLFNGGKISNGKLNLNNTLVYPLGIVKEDALECTTVGNFKEGQMFFDKEQGQLSIWDGTSWKSRVNYKVVDNKLNETLDGGKTWTPVSDYISANFRWSPENTIQINRTGKEEDWEDLSYKFANNVFIKGYIASYSALPSNPSLGDIYMVGAGAPYTMYVYTSDGWIDNGSYTSIAAGVLQTTGQSTTEVMSQKAVTEKLTELSAQTKGNLLPYTTIAWQYGNRYEEYSTGSSSYAPSDRMSTKPNYFIPVSKGITYLVYGASDIFKFACKFTIDKATTAKDSGWISSEYEYTPNEDGYFQMVLARQDNGVIDMNVLLENLPQIVVREKGTPIENIHFSADIIGKQMILDKTKTNQGSVKADSGEIVASTGADRAGYLDKIDVKGYEYIDLDGSIFDYYDVAVITFNKNLVKKDYGWGGKRRIALMPYSEYAILNFREKNNATINGYCLLYNNELSIGLGESAEPKNEPKKRNHIYKKNKLTHLAHRGLAASLPENSIASFVAAAEAGFDGIETDCQESADGTLYCMHDLTIDRTTNGTGTLRELSDAYLSGITLKDSQEPIPTIRDYIKVCKKYGMIPVIELKDGGISDDGIASLLSLLEQYGMKDTCVIISFSYKLLSIVRKLTEDVYVEPLLTPSLGNLLIASAFGNSGIDHDCTSTKLTEEHVLAAHKMGLNVNSYTIANAEQAEKMLNLGVDAITSHQFQGVN